MACATLASITSCTGVPERCDNVAYTVYLLVLLVTLRNVSRGPESVLLISSVMFVIACDTAASKSSTLRPSCENAVSAGRAQSRRSFQPPALRVNLRASSSLAFLQASFVDKRSSAAAVTVNMVHHPFVQCRIRPADSTHLPFAGDTASHGCNGHLQKSMRLPRDSFMSALSMIRYPVQLSVPAFASDSDSLSSGSDDEAFWSPDRWVSASVVQTPSGVSGLGTLLLFFRSWRFSEAFSRFI